MKKFLAKALLLTFAAVLISGAIGYAAFFCTGRVWTYSYQRGFIYQYRALQAADKTKPKMVFLGGSHVVFSLDNELMSKETGYPVYALGTYSNMGMLYVYELAEPLLNPGDVVVLPIVYTPVHPTYGMPLIYVTIGDEKDLLTDFLINHPMEVATSFAYGVEKRLYHLVESRFKGVPRQGAMDARNFNQKTGAYYYARKSRAGAAHYKRAMYDESESAKEFNAAINNLIAACRKKSVRVLAMPCQCWRDVIPSHEDIRLYDESLRRNIHAPVIASLEDYLFDSKHIYDVEFHLTSDGTTVWTKRAAADILSALGKNK